MTMRLLVAGAAVLGVFVVGSCSPPSAIDKTTQCNGQTYQLGRGEGGEAYIRVHGKLISCEKNYPDGGYGTCCAAAADYESEWRASQSTPDSDSGSQQAHP